MKTYRFNISGNDYEVTVNGVEEGCASVTVNGVDYDVTFQEDSPSLPSESHIEPSPAVCVSAPAGTSDFKVTAPIPGTVISVAVTPGQRVRKGETVAVIEAMKMENDITAEREGTVCAVHAKPGDSLSEGDAIVSLSND